MFLTLSTDFVSSPSLSFQTNLPGLFEMVPASGLYITAVRQRPPLKRVKVNNIPDERRERAPKKQLGGLRPTAFSQPIV